MKLTCGPAKSLDDITLEDVLEHSIWLWCWETGEEGLAGRDETWQQPVISTSDVTNAMIEPIISFRVKDTDIYGSGSYSADEEKLFGMALWLDGGWKLLCSAQIKQPLVLLAIPRIRGVENVEFLCIDLHADEARRI